MDSEHCCHVADTLTDKSILGRRFKAITLILNAIDVDCAKCLVKILQADSIVGQLDKDHALIYAVSECNATGVRVLLEHGADANFAEDDSSVLDCALGGGHAGCVQLIIEAGADVNLATKKGRFPLMSAALKGNAGCVRVLIDAGAAVNQQQSFPFQYVGWTSLHYASSNGWADCVQILVNAGANLDSCTRFGRTPAYEAVQTNWASCLRVLVEAGADVNLGNPMLLASQRLSYKCIYILGMAGARVFRRDRNFSPICVARDDWGQYVHTEQRQKCFELLEKLQTRERWRTKIVRLYSMVLTMWRSTSQNNTMHLDVYIGMANVMQWV